MASIAFATAAYATPVNAAEADTTATNEAKNAVEVSIDPDVYEAFEYLNAVRQNPGKYADEVGTRYLSEVEPREVLQWNTYLAAAAERKAKDMALNDYCDHVDRLGYGMNFWINKAGYELNPSFLKDKASSDFESLAKGVGMTGKLAIMALLYGDDKDNDDKTSTLRSHLLGINPFWATCYDIGIGHYESPTTGETYWCVLIAKHNYSPTDVTYKKIKVEKDDGRKSRRKNKPYMRSIRFF